MNKITIFTAVILISSFVSTTATSGDYGAAIDAQSEVMNQIMRDFGTVQSDNARHWRNMPERERYLRSTANKAVDYFKTKTGRYPTNQDVDFIRIVLKKTRVRNQTEAKLMLNQMDAYIRGGRELNEIEDDMCVAARRFTAQGFGHIYRSTMPECFK